VWRGWLDICHATPLFYVVAVETWLAIGTLPDSLFLANVQSSGAIQDGLAEVKGDDVDGEQANLIFRPLITR